MELITVATNNPYLEPAVSTQQPQNINLRVILILFFHLCLRLPDNVFFSTHFQTKVVDAILTSSLRATYPAHCKAPQFPTSFLTFPLLLTEFHSAHCSLTPPFCRPSGYDL